jgi:hypothetical protein
VSNIRKLLGALVRPYQDLEDTAQAMIAQRDVRVAVGAWLDQLGALVGQKRQGIADDDVYRRFVQARIHTNKSDGEPERMYRITRVILGDTEHVLELHNQGAAAYVMRIEGQPLDAEDADMVIRFLRQATSGGVRVIVEFGETDPDEWFRLDPSGPLQHGMFDESPMIQAVE